VNLTLGERIDGGDGVVLMQPRLLSDDHAFDSHPALDMLNLEAVRDEWDGRMGEGRWGYSPLSSARPPATEERWSAEGFQGGERVTQKPRRQRRGGFPSPVFGKRRNP
jgi:hypothetical protein